MKKSLALGVSLVLLTGISCKQQNSAPAETEPVAEEVVAEVPKMDVNPNIPDELSKVFDAHGGLENFYDKQTLTFEIENPEGNEQHITDLHSRKALIKTKKYAIGYDGENAWLVQDSTYFKNDPKFYYNLMFYFYAMPFILADNGITYEETPSLQVEGRSYPGYKISYGDGVGTSPDDNYFIYYDPKSHEMKYLGYTVTYFSKAPSDQVSMIEYAEWDDVDDLMLPKKIVWRKYEEGKIGDVKNTVSFTNAGMGTETPDPELFKEPEGNSIP